MHNITQLTERGRPHSYALSMNNIVCGQKVKACRGHMHNACSEHACAVVKGGVSLSSRSLRLCRLTKAQCIIPKRQWLPLEPTRQSWREFSERYPHNAPSLSLALATASRTWLQHPPSPPSLVQYASVEKEQQWFMTQDDFVCRYLQLTDSSTPREVVQLLSDMADTSKDK